MKDAFLQVLVDPAGAHAFGYVVDDLAIWEFRLYFGWCSRPGVLDLMASTILMEHSQIHTAPRGGTL